MRVLLVRHAHAGVRGSWPGDDLDRELSDRGHSQADAIVAQWAGTRTFTQVASSRAVRCVDTVEPLARKLDLKVTRSRRLLEGTAATEALEWVLSRKGHTIGCSHGDVIGGLVELLLGEGVAVRNADGSTVRPRWQKASTWELHVRKGEVRSATYHAPPA